MTAANNDKAFLETEDGTRIPCLFNPAELQMTRVNAWSADPMPGKGVPSLRYAGAISGKLRVSLFFDTTADGTAVTRYTNQLLALMEVNPSLPGVDEATHNARPPWVRFHWGDLHSFKAVITALDIRLVYFASDGTPLRARADVVMVQYERDLTFPRQNPTSGTPRPHRVHRVQPGETLDRISAVHYGDSTQWRRIADANGIEDPLRLRPGTLVAIPSEE